jgi:hypothetical protein
MHYDPTTKPLRAEADRLTIAGNDETERGYLDLAEKHYARAAMLRRLAKERGEYDDE